MRPQKPCKDCIAEGILTERPAPYPGPRCLTHHRLEKKRKSKAAHARRTEAVFGVDGETYWALYDAQGGKCAICRVATGQARRLAVDHDHETGMIRGLCCSPCNYELLGKFGKSLETALEYLRNPPAIEVIGCQYVPSTDATTKQGTLKPDGVRPTITDSGEQEV